MQSDILIMNVQGDFGVSGSNFKRSIENSSSEFKDFLISADGKINQKISAKKTIPAESNKQKFIVDSGEEKKSTNSEKLPEYLVKKLSADGELNSKGNSGTVQQDDLELIKKIKIDNVTGLDGLIFNSNLLNQIITKAESFDNSLTNELISEFSSASLGGVQLQSINSTDLTKDLETTVLKNGGDPELLKNLVDKIAEMLKNENKVPLVQSGSIEPEKILVFLQNQLGKTDLELSSSDISVQKFMEENISNIKSALEKMGIKVDELNIKEINLETSNPKETNPKETNPKEMNLKGTNLKETNLKETNLKGMDLKGTNLKEMNFEKPANSVSQLPDKKDGAMSKVIDSSVSQNVKDLFSLSFKPMDKESFDLLKNGFQTGFEKLVNNNIPVSKTESSLVPSTINPQQIIDTIVKEVTQTLTNHKMELEVKLMPESLGKLTIKVIMEEGKLSANIEVKNIDVKQVIETNLVKMRDDLGQHGINLDKINVFLSDSNQFTEKQERFFEQQKSNYKLEKDNFEINERINVIRSMGYNTIEYIV